MYRIFEYKGHGQKDNIKTFKRKNDALNWAKDFKINGYINLIKDVYSFERVKFNFAN